MILKVQFSKKYNPNRQWTELMGGGELTQGGRGGAAPKGTSAPWPPRPPHPGPAGHRFCFVPCGNCRPCLWPRRGGVVGRCPWRWTPRCGSRRQPVPEPCHLNSRRSGRNTSPRISRTATCPPSCVWVVMPQCEAGEVVGARQINPAISSYFSSPPPRSSPVLDPTAPTWPLAVLRELA